MSANLISKPPQAGRGWMIEMKQGKYVFENRDCMELIYSLYVAIITIVVANYKGETI